MSVAPLRRRAFVVGGYITPFIGNKHPDFISKKHPDFGKRENPALEDYIHEAVTGTLANTGTPASAVDKAWIGNFAGELFSSQGDVLSIKKVKTYHNFTINRAPWSRGGWFPPRPAE